MSFQNSYLLHASYFLTRARGTSQASQAMAWPVLATQFFLKINCNELKCYIFVSIFVLVAIFPIYLTAVHNMGLAKAWLTQGLTVTWYMTRDVFH